MENHEQDFLENEQKHALIDAALAKIASLEPEQRVAFLSQIQKTEQSVSKTAESRRQQIEGKEPALESANLEVFLAYMMPIFTAVAATMGIGAGKGAEALGLGEGGINVADLLGNIAAMVINPEEGVAKITEKYGEKAPKIIEKVQELMKDQKITKEATEKLSEGVSKILDRLKFIKEPSDNELRMMTSGKFINATTEKQFNSALKARGKRINALLDAFKEATPEEQDILRGQLSNEFTKYMQLQTKEVVEAGATKRLIKHEFTPEELKSLTDAVNSPDGIDGIKALFKKLLHEEKGGVTAEETLAASKRILTFAKSFFNTHNLYTAQADALLMHPKIWGAKAVVDAANQPFQLLVKSIGSAAYYQSLTVGQKVLVSALHAYREALPEAMRFMKATLESGKPEYEMFLGIKKPSLFANEMYDTTAPALSMKYLAAWYGVGPRIIMSIDQFSKVMARRSNLVLQSYFHALDEIGDTLAGSEKYRAAEKLAKDYLAEMPDWLNDAANKKMYEETFTNRTRLSEGLNSLANVPVVRNMFPFITTPLNLLTGGLKMTPFGFGTAAYKAFAGEGLEATVDVARAALGTSVALYLAHKVNDGSIIGSGPNNPKTYDIWKRTHPPKTIAGFDYSHLGSFGDYLTMVADATTFYGQSPEFDQYKLGWAMTRAFGHAVSHGPFMGGMENLVHMFDEIDRSPDYKGKFQATSRYLGSIASSFIPAPIGDVSRTLDPTYHQSRGMIDVIKEKIPGFSSTIPPELDIFGNPQFLPPGLSSEKTPPNRFGVMLNQLQPIGPPIEQGEIPEIDKEFANVGFSGSRPRSYIHANGAVAQLTPQQQYEWGVLAGKDLKIHGKSQEESMNQLIGSDLYKRASKEDKLKLLNEQHTMYMSSAREQIQKKYFPTLGVQGQMEQGGAPSQPGPTVIPVQKSLEEMRLGD